jgi:hypothetical protein
LPKPNALSDQRERSLETEREVQEIEGGMKMKLKIACGAHARSTGQPCRAQALANGRCKNHGGLSTGPRTPEGRRAVGEATRKRHEAKRLASLTSCQRLN